MRTGEEFFLGIGNKANEEGDDPVLHQMLILHKNWIKWCKLRKWR